MILLPVLNSVGGRKFNAGSMDFLREKGRQYRHHRGIGCGRWCPTSRAVFRVLKIRGIYVGSVVQRVCLFKNMNKPMSANADATRPIINKAFAFDNAKEVFAHLASQHILDIFCSSRMIDIAQRVDSREVAAPTGSEILIHNIFGFLYS
ncbi:hypothetical protein B0H13DRAFT_1863247 [Mycena leptocephala]|nr:hypothetical protein B0H13DRAFT_1863247 [Mycena leptocephala]